MKKAKLWIFLVGALVASLTFSACNDDDDSLGDIWMSVVTVNPLDNNTYSLVLDSEKKMWPAATDIPWYKPERKRAIAYYTILGENFEGYDYAILVRRLDNILTKNIVNPSASEDYGNDPLNIVGMWVGDGYLNVEFRFYYDGGKPHYINLVSTNNANEFDFRHNAYGNTEGYLLSSIVAFDLSTINTQGENWTLKIRANTFDGEKIYEVTYNSKKAQIEQVKLSSYTLDSQHLDLTKVY